MIVRAFRLTDKLGNAALKTFAWLSQLIVTYVNTFVTGASGVLAFGLSGLLALIWAIGTMLYRFIRSILSALVFLVGVLIALGQWLTSGRRFSLPGRGASVGQRTGPGIRSGGAAAEQSRLDTMARRADELAELVVLVEDPLKTRNRTLSALLIVMMAAVVVLLIWATSPARNVPPVVPGGVAALTTPEGQLTPFATVVPTVTPRPESLRTGGSLVYTLRENGQDDLWVSVIGFDRPIRITNHPADDRDPTWSPDGHFLAYTSNRDGNWELYVQDVRTGSATRLTYTLGFEGSPSWSPDGQWLVYEGYNEDNLDVYITRVDGSQGPIRLTQNPAPDYEPMWSPGGREIVFVSLRDGNQDIYALSLDDPTEALAQNLTNTPGVNEDHPAWSPDGMNIAYSAVVDGLEAVYVLAVDALDTEPVIIDRGRAPTWSPDGNSLVYAIDQESRTLLLAGQYQTVGVTSQAVMLPARGTDPDWTAWQPQGAGGSGVVASADEVMLYTEEISSPQEEAPYYRPILLGDVDAPLPYLSDRVNDSFMALRRTVLEKTGEDYLGMLEDALWLPDRLPEPGQERLNWHMTGRSFALNRNLIFGFPSPLEIVREDIGVGTYWRVYARAAVQDGQLGEPLRRLPWDFTARTGGDVQAYEEGGRLRAGVPSGYYIDLTRLFSDYGWERVPAHRSWRANFGGVLFWQYVKTDGLTWEAAMLELYSDEDLSAFLTEPTPFPTPTLAPPTPTPEPSRTPTPVPPDLTSP